jgi:hypothetical protein
MTGNNKGGNPNLVPFTKGDERAKAAGRASAAARAAKRAAEAEAQGELAARAAQTLQEWSATFQREELGDRAALAAQKIADDVLTGAIVVDARSAAPLLTALVDIARIEAGLHTSATLTATITSEQMTARLDVLRQQAGGHNQVGTQPPHILESPPLGSEPTQQQGV